MTAAIVTMLALLVAWSVGAQLASDEAPEGRGGALLLTVQDAIGPATADYIVRGIERAEEDNASLVVIELDTPGGLDSSMRAIIQSILASSVPVAVYVWPQGARAASAGTYILYASHIAAMAPATNLGAATPVPIGGTSPAPAGDSPSAPGQPSGDRRDDPGSRGGDDRGSDRTADRADDRTADGGDDRGGERSGAQAGGQGGEQAGDRGGEQAGERGGEQAGERGGQQTGDRSDDGSTDRRDDRTTDSPAPPAGGSASELKAINDAVAYIRSLAERRGRNADWAERAVREAASLSAERALELGVIDYVARDLDDLFRQIDGLQIELPVGEVTLDTDGLVVQRIDPDWRTRFLAVITNPTLAYMLLLVGIYGLILEGYNPGAILPGVVGAISLLLALFALQVLPVNFAGLALILLGVILIIAEFLVPSFGALGIGGVAAFVIGSIILMDTDVPGFGISMTLITSLATASALVLLGVVWLAMRSRERPVVSGSEQLSGASAVALEDFVGEGAVRVFGERWRAHSPVPVQKGQRLRIARVEGLLLYVEPLDPGAPAGRSALSS